MSILRVITCVLINKQLYDYVCVPLLIYIKVNVSINTFFVVLELTLDNFVCNLVFIILLLNNCVYNIIKKHEEE